MPETCASGARWSVRRTRRRAPGFELRHVVTDTDIEARAFVEGAAFEGSVAADTWRLLRGRLPGYVPELDLIAAAPDGTGASACTCWYEASTRCGEVEAVGTAPEYRRMGLSRAVIVEGLRRLYGMGARSAVVQTTIGNTPAIALYPSCGFQYAGEDRAWVK